jgi:hypothetical protein
VYFYRANNKERGWKLPAAIYHCCPYGDTTKLSRLHTLFFQTTDHTYQGVRVRVAPRPVTETGCVWFRNDMGRVGANLFFRIGLDSFFVWFQ